MPTATQDVAAGGGAARIGFVTLTGDGRSFV